MERHDASSDAPRHRMLSGEREYEDAIDQVIARAGSTLHIFDASLARGGYGSVRRHQALQDFLRRSRGNRMEVVLHETDYFSAHCPRLVQLLRTYSHAIAVHKTEEHARLASDPFVIADGLHYVHRFHSEGARLLLALHDPAGGRQLEDRFGQLLQASRPAVFATTLGL